MSSQTDYIPGRQIIVLREGPGDTRLEQDERRGTAPLARGDAFGTSGLAMARADLELLSLIASGNGAAFADFYDRHAPRLLNLLLGWLGRREDAEDVLQETFWQVWRQAGRYDVSRSPVGAWLVLLARSRALDNLRRRQPEPAPVAGNDPAMPWDPLGMLEEDESAQKVREALGRLPEDQRAAVTLAFFGGLTNEQVARQQAIPLGTAKTRIRLAMVRLRDLLRHECEVPDP